MSRVNRLLAFAVVLIALPLVVRSQNPAPAQVSASVGSGKPTLTRADYDKFESISGSALSPDGKWAAYVVGRGERGAARGGRGGEVPGGELHYRAIASDAEKTIANASNPT